MRKSFLFFYLFVFVFVAGSAQQQKKISKADYIELYKNIAIDEMKRSGIPASVTIAQGMLESDNGNSRLTRDGNNHFGIKCHDWTGKGIYVDDDKRNECFRSYPTAMESFRDHTDFLLTRQRYSFLFAYKSTDYKSWAKGLKKAGYATNRSYDDMLIKIIEENQLFNLDSNTSIVHSRSAKKQTEDTSFGFAIRVGRPVYKRNDIEYVITKKGDSFDKLAQELELLSWEIIKYNELSKDSTIHDGQILYLQPKHRKAAVGQEYHTVQAGESIYSISQLYGIKTRLVRKWNNLSSSDSVKDGDVLNLRFRKRK